LFEKKSLGILLSWDRVPKRNGTEVAPNSGKASGTIHGLFDESMPLNVERISILGHMLASASYAFANRG
jgi:hypothetical protein